MTTNKEVEAFLEHFGVKGMRWGVRNNGAGASSGKAFAENYIQGATWNKKPELAKKNMSTDQLLGSVVAQVNPGFPKHGTKMNCRRCSLTYELRRRGYDVKATTKNAPKGQDLSGTLNMLDRGQGSQLYKPGIFGAVSNLRYDKKQRKADSKADTPFKDKLDEFKVKNNSSLVMSKVEIFRTDPSQTMTDAIFSGLNKLPDRSRGEINVHFGPYGIGHSMAFEVVNKKAVVFDTQRGIAYRNANEIVADKKLPNIGTAAFTRLDNAPLNPNFLKDWSVNA